MKMREYEKTRKTEYGKKAGFLKVLASFCVAMVFLFSSSSVAYASVDGGTGKTTRYGLSFESNTNKWDAYLEENEEARLVYDTFSKEMDEEGNRLFSDEFIIGLLANMEHEGTPGKVEGAFANCGQYGFRMPSGKNIIQDKADIDYLLSWTIVDDEYIAGCVRKGSCGVSSLQWSFGRRITWLKILEDVLEEEGKTSCNISDFYKANMKMFLKELTPTKSETCYYNLVVKAAEKNGGDVESYAEAICDYYVAPGGADLDMSGTGSACKERRESAARIGEIYQTKSQKDYFTGMIPVVRK